MGEGGGKGGGTSTYPISPNVPYPFIRVRLVIRRLRIQPPPGRQLSFVKILWHASSPTGIQTIVSDASRCLQANTTKTSIQIY